MPSLIQMQLSLKQKACSNFVILFLESASNFIYFEKKDDRHSFFIAEITDCERLV